jgi:hypothetical protein
LPLWTIGILTASGTDSIAAHATGAIRIDSAFETGIVDAEQSGRAIAVRPAPFGTDASVAVLTGRAVLRRTAASASALAAYAVAAVAILTASGAGAIAARPFGAISVLAAFGTRAIAADALGAIAVLATFSASAFATHAVRAITVLTAFGAGSIAADPVATVAVITATGTRSIATVPVVAIVVRAAFGAGSVAADAIGAVGIRTAFDADSGDTMRAIRTVVVYATFGANVSATTSILAVAVRSATSDASASATVLAACAILRCAALHTGFVAANTLRAVGIRTASDAGAVNTMGANGTIIVDLTTGRTLIVVIAILTGWTVVRTATICTQVVSDFVAVHTTNLTTITSPATILGFKAGMVATQGTLLTLSVRETLDTPMKIAD